MTTLSHMIATVFRIGHLRPAPGSWGSAAALPLTYVLHVLGGPLLLVIGTLAAFTGGLWATRQETLGSSDHDPSEIVVDELAGQMVALLPISLGAWMAGAPITALWPGWIAGFVLFRLFDILKPGPVGWADRRADALGVMLDDLIAGLLAAICVVILAIMAHAS